MEKTTWQHLPLEIVEKILIYVPTSDLLFSKPWVCKSWTNILLQPEFWIRKLLDINITVNDEIRSALAEFERKLQVACLYHACINEEQMLLEKANNEIDLSLANIYDNTKNMLTAIGVLVIRSVELAGLILTKERQPVLPILLKLLAVREIWVNIYDYFGFWHFSPRYDYLQMLKRPNDEAKVEFLIGCVPTINGLVQEWDDDIYADLKLSIAVDGKNKAVDPGISTRHFDINLIHITAGTDMSTLEIGKYSCSELIISGLEATHISWMISLARKLKLQNGYSLVLFNYLLGKKSTEILFHSWKRANVEPVDIMCASTTLNAKQAKKLNELAALLWFGCEDEYFVWYKSDKKLRECRKFHDLLYNQ